jgi:pimeloyl-ACP methyl ester carboxylesterase
MLTHAELALAAAKAYQGPWAATAGDVHYTLLRRKGELVVALPGTADVEDWLRDLSAWPAWFHGLGLVHEGFGSGAVALWADLASVIAAEDEGTLVTFTGHSLGGALAQCLAVLHARSGSPLPFRVVTFGAPRVAVFVDLWFRHSLHRARELAAYARNGDVVPGAPFWPLFLHMLRLTRIGVSTGDPITNHDMALYAANVAALPST